VVVCCLLVVGLAWRWDASSSGKAPFDLSQATYVGSESCARCHAEQVRAHQGSHHAQAMAPATPATVKGDFSGVELEHWGVTSRMFRDGDRFVIHTEGPDGVERDYEVKYVFGVEPLQQYLVEFDADHLAGGSGQLPRLQALRVSWDTVRGEWFHLDPPDVRQRLAPEDDLHWTGAGQRWNSMCADCHSTDYQRNYDAASGRYHSTFSEIHVGCEACHGPGSEHIRLAESWLPGWNRQRGFALANLKRSAEDEIMACAPCHSRRDTLAGGFRAGDDFFDYYANQLLLEPVYYADGQILDEVFEHGSFLQSKMYHKGIRCTDCHDPHTARLKHDGNALCTSCHQHPVAKYDSVAHHFHQPGSAGAQCVNCHMPSTTYMDVHSRRDHSLRIPRPDLSLELGTPNACTACHVKLENISEEKRPQLSLYQDWMRLAREGDAEVRAELERADRWTDAACDKWYGATRRREPHFGSALHAAQQRDATAVAQLQQLLGKRGSDAPAIARATALELLGGLDPVAAGEAAVAAMKDEHPLVRAAACEVLLGNRSRTLAVSLLSDALSDPRRLVRNRAARSLVLVPAEQWPQGAAPKMRAVLSEVAQGLQVSNDRAGAHLTLGVLAEQQRDFQAAVKHYRDAIRVEPEVAGPRSNLATLLEERLAGGSGSDPSAGQAVRAEIVQLRQKELELLARDAGLLPDAAALQYRYGLALVLARQKADAVAPLRRAAELEPSNPEFVRAIALLLQDLGRASEAVGWARRLRELTPEDPQSLAILRDIEQAAR
jgi:predicted CXXCH cytochrome family protein